eukprot:CAMPEP_0172451366 /NCGR_PEP_ID=MMETSP1065-20121228/9443_1 /TAXON_ID=265537 /ORGANISM="Amphiprora paludosa, Strain CCMP125" /LENGTH=33 /DNA_ID= /DNA_START= /DNA_END= /DNA_ORIENTATION=
MVELATVVTVPSDRLAGLAPAGVAAGSRNSALG